MNDLLSGIGKRLWLLFEEVTVVAVALGLLGIVAACVFMVKIVRSWLQ